MDNIVEEIQQSNVYKQILNDSFGGIMYDVSNRGKYDTTELLKLWQNIPASEKEAAGGIVSGVFNFLESGE